MCNCKHKPLTRTIARNNPLQKFLQVVYHIHCELCYLLGNILTLTLTVTPLSRNQPSTTPTIKHILNLGTYTITLTRKLINTEAWDQAGGGGNISYDW